MKDREIVRLNFVRLKEFYALIGVYMYCSIIMERCRKEFFVGLKEFYTFSINIFFYRGTLRSVKIIFCKGGKSS